MSKESTESHVQLSIPLIRYLQRESLTALEYNLVLYIFEHSINFSKIKNHGHPMWVEISPSEYANTFGYHRVAVSKSLSKLAYLGIFDVTTTKKMGVEYRHFKVADRERIGRVLVDVNQLKVNRKKVKPVANSLQGVDGDSLDPVANSLQSDLKKTNRKYLHCSLASYGPVAQPATALLPSQLQACSPASYRLLENPVRFQGVRDVQECIKNLKEYFKNATRFSGLSYFDVIDSSIQTRIRRRNLKVTLKRSIDHYGLFSVWMAIHVHLLNKELYFDNFEALNAILKTHKNEMQKFWDEILLEVDNLYYEISAYELHCDSKMLDFDTHVRLFLTSKRTEKKSSLIFLFDSFESTVIESKLLSVGNIDSFREKIIKKLNLFFKNKILGERDALIDEIESELL